METLLVEVECRRRATAPEQRGQMQRQRRTYPEVVHILITAIVVVTMAMPTAMLANRRQVVIRVLPGRT